MVRKIPVAYFLMAISLLLCLILEYYLFLHVKNNNYLNLNALFLTLTSISIGILYLSFDYTQHSTLNIVDPPKKQENTKRQWLWVLWGIVSIALCFEEIRKLLASYPSDYNSDVLYVMEAQARRAFEGKLPYDIVSVKNSYDVFPPYLPAFWLPMLVPMYMGMDPRWAAYVVLALSVGVFAYFYGGNTQHPLMKLVGIGLFSCIIWSFYFFDPYFSLTSTSEALIVAYYLLLMTGIYYENKFLIVLAFILCLLSRYNLLFWLPLFAVIFLQKYSQKDLVKMAIGLALGMLILYVFPFLIKQPESLFKSYQQWEKATLAHWMRAVLGNDSSISNGLSFNAFFYNYLSNLPVAIRFAYMKYTQMFVLVCFTILSIIGWHYKFSHIFHYQAYLIATLKIYFALFFAFSPIVFSYYLMPVLGMSIFLFVQAIAGIQIQKYKK
jgi:hypothetical protein